MATADERGVRTDRVESLLDRFGLDWVRVAVVGVTVLALAARLYDLGARVAHWDEARVGYWTIEYMKTGNVEYRPIIHGPFYHHVNAALFDVVGATDFSMRLVVAALGGVFPLVALLFRHRLRDVEVVALAGALALTPVLLYYSRFMRGDPLVATFMFTAFACFVRAFDTGRVAYAFPGVAFTALAFTVKENAVLYLLCWAGAWALVADARFLRDDDAPDPAGLVGDWLRRGWGLLRRHFLALVLLAVEFLAIIVFFYAPRGETDAGPGLWTVLDDPGNAGAVLSAATVGSWQKLWGLWVAGSHQDHSYIPYFGDFLQVMGHGALAVSLLALLGFVVDRYGAGGPRTLPSFCFYWGLFSVFGYPLVTDIMAPWATVNAVVPLAVPAAVGFGLFVGWAREGIADADPVHFGVSVFAVVIVLGTVVGTSVGAVYANPQSDENHIVQYAQPGGDIQPVMDALDRAAAREDGPHVVFYGEYFTDDGDASVPRQPGCIRWFNALPLPWYLATADAETTCTNSTDALASTVEEEQPAVVVVRQSDEGALAGSAPNYESRTYLLRTWGTETTFFVREAYADDLPPADG